MFEIRPHKIQIKTTDGGGTDDNGDPIPVGVVWTDPIEAHFSTDSKETLYTYPDGRQANFSYAVWFDPIEENLEGTFIRLIDQYGNIELNERYVQKCVNGQLRTKLYL